MAEPNVNEAVRLQSSIDYGVGSMIRLRGEIGHTAIAYAIEEMLRTQDNGDPCCCVCYAYRKAADAVRDAAYEESGSLAEPVKPHLA